VYRDPRNQIVDFAFDETVAEVFTDMIRRSVPGYETVVPMTGLIAARALADGDTAFDLGCSLGATTLAVLRQTVHQSVRVVGVDSSPAMVQRARELVTDPRATFRCERLETTDLDGARVVLMNWVLQFVPPAQRLSVLRRIRSTLAPDGLLIVSEKVRFDDARLHALFDETHLAWKRANGYSELEISGKREALENVMVIDSEPTHLERFDAAGFGNATAWFRCLNWISFLVRP
jgi:tRNA (cmo5U34)-methyltransferase